MLSFTPRAGEGFSSTHVLEDFKVSKAHLETFVFLGPAPSDFRVVSSSAHDNAGRAGFPAGTSAFVSAFHHLWGCAHASLVVEQLTGTLSHCNDP